MPIFKVLLLSLLTFVLVLSCASPQKSFDKGNYEKAYKQAVKNVAKGSNKRKDRTLLNKSFNEILKEKSDNIDRYASSNVIEDWEEAYKEYESLIDLYYDGKRYLDKEYVTLMGQKETEQQQLQNDIAQNYLELGHMKMDQYESNGNKRFAQEAHEYYTRTQYYDPYNDTIDALLVSSYESAIVNVYVEAESIWEMSYSWIIDRKFSELERESEGFYVVSFEKNQDIADCSLLIEFSSLDEDRSERRNTERFSREIEDGFETRQDTSGNTIQVPKYTTVTGEVTTITEIYEYEWRARVNSYGSEQYCDFRSRSFDAEEEIVYEYYEVSGDNRAIPDNYSNTSFSQRDLDDIVEELLDELYSDIENYYF